MTTINTHTHARTHTYTHTHTRTRTRTNWIFSPRFQIGSHNMGRPWSAIHLGGALGIRSFVPRGKLNIVIALIFWALEWIRCSGAPHFGRWFQCSQLKNQKLNGLTKPKSVHRKLLQLHVYSILVFPINKIVSDIHFFVISYPLYVLK